MPGFLSRHLDHLLHRSRSRSRDREPSQATTTSTDVTTPHHIVEFVKSPDGLTYIAPPYMVGVPVTQWSPAPQTFPESVPSTAPSASLNPVPLEPSLIFANPVLAGWSAEPSIVRVGTEFFMTTASACCFPGLPIYRSGDLVNWELIGHGLGRKEQWVGLGGKDGRGNEIVAEKGEMSMDLEGIRTPTLRATDGGFYLMACWWEIGKKNLPRSFYIHSNNILDDASWSEPIFLDNHGLGQDLFFDHDGKSYLNTTDPINHTTFNAIDQSTISTSEIDIATGKSLKVPTIVQSNHSNLNGVSHVIKRDKYYYLFTTETTGPLSHQGCVSRSEQGPFPPWEPSLKNPLWCDGPDDEIQKISHVDVFEDTEEKWWAVFSGMRPRKKADEEWTASVLGQETFLVKVEWEDGWPTFNGGKKIGIVTSSHSDKLKKLPKYDCVVGLDVEAKDDGYHFSVSTQKDYEYVVASVPYGTLMKSAAAVRGDVTGAMFGLYALAEEEPCTDVADFGDVLVVNKDRS